MPQVPDMRGFPGGYFHIRAAGTQHYWAIYWGETSHDGNALQLWPSVNDKAVRQQYYISIPSVITR